MDVLRRYLDPEQLEIAVASDESLIVLAGPGSGKTRLLTQVAAYQARKSEPSNAKVLCLTFSVQATREMQGRLTEPDLGVRRRRVQVANFHQLGSELLGAYGHHIGWPRDAQIADTSDTDEVVEELLRDFRMPGVKVFDAKQAISRLRNNRGAESDLPAESLVRLAAAYRIRLRDLNLRDFDDLILQTLELLDTKPEVAEIVRACYSYIVVDELQDTSGHQLELVARISGEGQTPTFAVADNDQMIYAWRDAREENLTEWETRFAARRVALLGNYRCPERIVRAANALIGHNPRIGSDLGEPYSRVEHRPGQLVAARAANDWEEGELVAGIVSEQLGRGVEPGRIAILSANRFPFERIGEALAERDVDYVRVGDDPSAARPFVRALRAALVFNVSPGNERARARLVRLLGLGADPNQAGEATAAIAAVANPWALHDVVREVLGLESDDPDVAHAAAVLALATREFGSQPVGMAGQRLALEWHRLNARLQREAEGVKLMTTFAAKGLEYDTVILPRFGEGQVPYVPRGVRPGLSWWYEERRKVYVAITRAQNSVFFVYSTRQPSTFLGEIPPDLLAVRA